MKTKNMTALKKLQSFRQNNAGVTMIEYALIAGLIAIAAVGAIQSVGNSINSLFGDVSTVLENASSEVVATTTTAPIGAVSGTITSTTCTSILSTITVDSTVCASSQGTCNANGLVVCR